jgi:hypothetical protein
VQEALGAALGALGRAEDDEAITAFVLVHGEALQAGESEMLWRGRGSEGRMADYDLLSDEVCYFGI